MKGNKISDKVAQNNYSQKEIIHYYKDKYLYKRDLSSYLHIYWKVIILYRCYYEVIIYKLIINQHIENVDVIIFCIY